MSYGNNQDAIIDAACESRELNKQIFALTAQITRHQQTIQTDVECIKELRQKIEDVVQLCGRTDHDMYFAEGAGDLDWNKLRRVFASEANQHE